MFLHSFPENEIVLRTIEDNIDNFSNTYLIVRSFEGHVVKKVKELYEYAVEVRATPFHSRIPNRPIPLLKALLCANTSFRHFHTKNNGTQLRDFKEVVEM